MHALSPEAFWPAMAARYGPNPALDHPAVRRMLLPLLQADFLLVETWRPSEDDSRAAARSAARRTWRHSRCQVGSRGHSAVSAAAPPHSRAAQRTMRRYTRDQLLAWRCCAPAGAGGFEARWFDGGHRCVRHGCPCRPGMHRHSADMPVPSPARRSYATSDGPGAAAAAGLAGG